MLLQLVKFGAVGVVAALVDVGVLVLLKELLQVDVLLASAISFLCFGYRKLYFKYVFCVQRQKAKQNQGICYICFFEHWRTCFKPVDFMDWCAFYIGLLSDYKASCNGDCTHLQLYNKKNIFGIQRA